MVERWYKRAEIWAIIIAIISLASSGFFGFKTLQYNDDIKELQANQQELDEKSVGLQEEEMDFEQTAQKIALVGDAIRNQVEDCKNCNRTEILNKIQSNMELFTNASKALIDDETELATSYLKGVDFNLFCTGFTIKEETSEGAEQVTGIAMTEKVNATWLWLIIGIIVVLILIGIAYGVKKEK